MSEPINITAKNFGREIANGFVDRMAIWFVAFCLVCLALGWAGRHFTPPDNTDVSRESRSGLKIRHDALTGCEYLEAAGGGLTPRIGRDGLQICGRGQ